jgi:hypothetical protein
MMKNPAGLSLNGLTELSDAAARHLSRHKGVLHLKGLKSLTPAAATALARMEGTINKLNPAKWVASLRS